MILAQIREIFSLSLHSNSTLYKKFLPFSLNYLVLYLVQNTTCSVPNCIIQVCIETLPRWSLVHCIVCAVLHCILLIIISYNVQQSRILYYGHCRYSTAALYANLCGTVLYTVQKGQCKFKLRKHDTYHMMGISTLCNVKMFDISANVDKTVWLSTASHIPYYFIFNWFWTGEG